MNASARECIQIKQSHARTKNLILYTHSFTQLTGCEQGMVIITGYSDDPLT